MLARVIEAAGIPTVTVTMMPVLSQKYRSSRVVGVEYPFGHGFGPVGDSASQRTVLLAALGLLVDAESAGARTDVDDAWPGDPKAAYKDWQPLEPSPIVSASLARIRAEAKAARPGRE